VDVRVKLLLQGGHAWEFCCDEEDPILFALVATLQGPNLSENLPSDGLIQLNTRTGERLYLTRASLISIELVPINSETQLSEPSRLVEQPSQAGDRLASPAIFAMVPNALPEEMHRALLRHALAQHDELQGEGEHGVCELSLNPMHEAVAQAFRDHVEKSRSKFGMESSVTKISLRLHAIGNATSLSLKKENRGTLCLIYQFHAQPKSFTGGGIRLFDRRFEAHGKRAGDGFRDIEIDDNSLLIFPNNVVSAGLPVFSEKRSFVDRLFALSGSIRFGGASE
jgi:hypothetical protein